VIAQWIPKLLLDFVVVAILYIGVLVFPSPLFAYSESYGT
jgi:hypothetical protein